jgi:hypothetical protein
LQNFQPTRNIDLENLTGTGKGLRNHTKLFNSRQRFGIILSLFQAVNLVIVIVENKMLKLSLGFDMNWELSIATLQLFKFPQNISKNNFLIFFSSTLSNSSWIILTFYYRQSPSLNLRPEEGIK